MSHAQPFLVLGPDLAPLLGAAGGMVAIAFSAAGFARTPPAIVERGLGVYAVTTSDSDESERTIVMIDTGAGNTPRRVTISASRADGSNQFLGFHLETAAGGLWTGDPPTISAGGYVGASGVARTPPGIVALAGSYLWALVPTPADLEAEVSVRIDTPAGCSVPFVLGWADPLSTGALGPFTPPRTGSLVRSSDGRAVLR